MRKFLLTTALLTAMSTMPALAQSAMPDDFVAPDGYQSAAADTLTFQDLMGATVYDVRGESIGDISDFVMAIDPSAKGAAAPMTDGASTGTDTAMTGTATGTASDTATATDGNVSSGTGSVDATGTEGAGTASGTAATDGTMTDGTGTAATDGTMTEGAGTASGTAATDGTMTNDTATTDGTMTDGTSTASGTAATDGTMTTDGSATSATTDMAAGSEGEMTGSITGQVSHAIIDVGGFLGMGTHTVAVPVEALQVFRGSSASDVRVYMPWNEEQLKQIPAYVEGDMTTVGSMPAMSN